MAKAIHKSCCLQAGASEAVALIEKVISEEQTWGTYKIDKTETDGAYAAFVCTPVWTFSLYHNSFVPDTHITVREDNGKSQIGFDFTQCRSAICGCCFCPRRRGKMCSDLCACRNSCLSFCKSGLVSDVPFYSFSIL